MKFTSYLIADISTANITERDGELLRQSNYPVIGQIHDGQLVHIDDAATCDARFRELLEEGFSEWFANIMEAVAEEGIHYIRFSANTTPIPGIPVFDW